MNTRYVKPLLLATVVLPWICFAEEKNQDTNPNYPAGIRNPKDSQEEVVIENKYASKEYPPIYYPAGIHTLYAVSAIGDSVEFEDGSVWKIAAEDRYKVSQWGSQEPITVTQNNTWFSKYKYKIVNQTTGSVLQANLYLGPLKDGLFTLYITAIDTSRGELILNDSTRWSISDLDITSFDEWMIHDAVIIGLNSGWDKNCQALLINVPLNTYVRAKEF